jgi:hypothetical protein
MKLHNLLLALKDRRNIMHKRRSVISWVGVLSVVLILSTVATARELPPTQEKSVSSSLPEYIINTHATWG